MSEFEDIFQPIAPKEFERRKRLAMLEKICSRKRCGICDYWMKTSACPPEGRGMKMHMNSHICTKFKLELHYVIELRGLRKDVA